MAMMLHPRALLPPRVINCELARLAGLRKDALEIEQAYNPADDQVRVKIKYKYFGTLVDFAFDGTDTRLSLDRFSRIYLVSPAAEVRAKLSGERYIHTMI